MTHETIQKRKPLAMVGDGAEIPTQQIQDAEWQQGIQLLLKQGLLIGKFSHPLLQLDALPEDPCCTLVTTLLLFSLSSRTTGQCRNERQVGFTAASEGWSLGRLQSLAGHHKSLMGSPRLPEKDQPGRLTAGGQIHANGLVGMGFAERQ